ncbi:MAG: NifB/NifX family molybdenum-iron cluster-binding protein [Kiritimatiellia bacterium]|jgi:predicted Fe-Mo cluster-binding NifX family protein
MKTAISIFQNRIAPVFDTAQDICLVERDDVGAPTKTFRRFDGNDPQGKVAWLVEANVQTLVCGAISQPLQLALETAGIAVVPFVCGDLDAIIAAQADNTLGTPAFAMPGCCGRRRGAGRGCGAGRGSGRCRRAGRGGGMGQGRRRGAR